MAQCEFSLTSFHLAKVSRFLVKYFSKFFTIVFGLTMSPCNGGSSGASESRSEMTLIEFTNRWYEEARITDTDNENELLEWLDKQAPDDWHAIISK